MSHHTGPNAVFRKRQNRTVRSQVTPEEQELHEKAKLEYPLLSLSPGEYVLETVRRHPIGLIGIWTITGFLVLLILALVPFYAVNIAGIADFLNVSVKNLPSAAVIATPALILVGFFLLGGAIATYVYQQNRFYITTESIIQFVQYSLFNSKQQVVNLINVEDASADQTGILQQVLNYGTLRLSTQGEETIYHFRFVANPNRVVHNINDATEIAIQRLEGSVLPPTELAG
ncbi:MAG TPA: PH domain-containing protein [Magnetospirillaceae bacterium]|nr:PH domain-containing protein [Magnetospirillaceae bacterium]